MNAEQYRALVNKIEAINEADTIQGAQPTGGATNIDQYKPHDKIPEVKANSLAQAMQIAQQKGYKQFRFCMKYGTGKAKAKTSPKTPGDPWLEIEKRKGRDHPATPQKQVDLSVPVKPLATPPTTYRAESVKEMYKRMMLGELAYGEEDPNHPGYMWVPNDGTTPIGDNNAPKQMIRAGDGGFWNAKMVPMNKPAPAPEPEPATPHPVAPQTDIQPAPVAAPAAKCDIETQAKIKYMKSFNQAFAAARQSECDQFTWCGIYTVPAPKPKPNLDTISGPEVEPDNSGANAIDSFVNGNPGRADIDKTQQYFNDLYKRQHPGKP
jgi:hypothetical protein